MKNMTLENMAAACGGRLILPAGWGDGQETGRDPRLLREAAAVVLDSRQAGRDSVFVAVNGERVDGHRFIPDVFTRGALGVVCEKLPECPDGPCILVEDSLRALRQIGAFYRRQLPVRVVGITGSMGKTSTKEFVASVLAEKFRVHKTKGNYNNEIGVPLTVLSMPEETQTAVLEMGINHFGEMHRLSEIAAPNLVVMTNIGQCHLEYLGSREGILKAKSEIFDFMAEDGLVFVNGDDDLLSALGPVKGRKPVTFGRGENNDIRALRVENRGLRGSEALIDAAGELFWVSIPLPGEHMVYNALAAAAVGSALGMTAQEIARGIASVQPTGGRSHIIETEDMVLIDDCYNANPASMEAALDLLSSAQGRTVAVLGDMFELGENEAALHERVGRYAVQKGIDCILTAGSLGERLAAAAAKEAEKEGNKGCLIRSFADREELQEALPGLLQSRDTVLIKASHAMGFEKLVEALSDGNA